MTVSPLKTAKKSNLLSWAKYGCVRKNLAILLPANCQYTHENWRTVCR